jgi:hypothetical protein
MASDKGYAAGRSDTTPIRTKSGLLAEIGQNIFCQPIEPNSPGGPGSGRWLAGVALRR